MLAPFHAAFLLIVIFTILLLLFFSFLTFVSVEIKRRLERKKKREQKPVLNEIRVSIRYFTSVRLLGSEADGSCWL